MSYDDSPLQSYSDRRVVFSVDVIDLVMSCALQPHKWVAEMNPLTSTFAVH